MSIELSQRLRKVITEIRRKPYPIADLIPLLSQAADAIHQATQAEVTDDLIAVTAAKSGFSPMLVATDGGAFRRFARAILAMRPVQVPMDKQDAWDNSPVNSDWEAVDAYLQGIEDAEAHHGITAQAKKEGA